MVVGQQRDTFARARRWSIGMAFLAMSGLGCGLDSEGSLPPHVEDPTTLQTPAGAMARYRGAVAAIPGMFDGAMLLSAMLSDELAALPAGSQVFGTYSGLDSRQFTEDAGSQAYRRLHYARAQAREARDFIRSYVLDTDTTIAKPALVGHLFAVEGYANLLLAELFCSGIPLSTVNFDGSHSVATGSTTTDVLDQAIVLLDSAITLGGEDLRVQPFAPVARGRVLLALGRYDEAATAVATVPTEARAYARWSYSIFATPDGRLNADSALLWGFPLVYNGMPGTPSAADREGFNGLDYRSSGDPRTRTIAYAAGVNGALYFPAKYPDAAAGTVDFTLADGIEARLIEAEAALQTNPDDGRWLALLNQLRTSGPIVVPPDTIADTLGVTGCTPMALCGASPGGSDPSFGQPVGGFPVPPGYTFAFSYTIDPVSQDIRDHCWNASWYIPCYENFMTTVLVYTAPERTAYGVGTGGVPGLAPLADPGPSTNDTARVNLVFRERAFWLYMTGHRLGDLRRLVRNYGRASNVTYPVGEYPGGVGSYGNEVVVPVPKAERDLNPRYAGCFHRNA